MPAFAAAITCIDGRFHAPLVTWMRAAFGVDHVDLVTAPGVAAALAQDVPGVSEQVLGGLEPSLAAHGTRIVVVAAHEGCAADPSGPTQQRADLARAAEGVRTHLRDRAHVVALHLGADGTVVPLSEHGARAPDHEAREQPTRTGASR